MHHLLSPLQSTFWGSLVLLRLRPTWRKEAFPPHGSAMLLTRQKSTHSLTKTDGLGIKVSVCTTQGIGCTEELGRFSAGPVKAFYLA